MDTENRLHDFGMLLLRSLERIRFISHRTLHTTPPLRVLLLLTLLFLTQGCQYDPYAHLYTTEKPQAADIVGHYTLKSQTAIAGGLSALKGRESAIELRANSMFTAANVPAWGSGPPYAAFLDTLISGSGTWRIESVGSVDDGLGPLKTHWGVYLDSKATKIHPVGLTGQKPPYGLIFTLGDPDNGHVMFFERAK